jgi:hypothetical protein
MDEVLFFEILPVVDLDFIIEWLHLLLELLFRSCIDELDSRVLRKIRRIKNEKYFFLWHTRVS